MPKFLEGLFGRGKKEVKVPEPKVVSSETFLGNLKEQEREKVEEILGMVIAISANPKIHVIGLGTIAEAKTPTDAEEALDIDIALTTDTPPESEIRKNTNDAIQAQMLTFLSGIDLNPERQEKTSIKKIVVRGRQKFKDSEDIYQPGIKTKRFIYRGIRPIHIMLQSNTSPSHSAFMQELQATGQTYAILLPLPGAPVQ